VDVQYAAGFGPFASGDPAPSTHNPAAWDAAGFAAKSAQYDRDIIAKARLIAEAKNVADLRHAIPNAYPFHAESLAATADADVFAYAHGVMAEVIRELANLAEREINRNA
jgi:hypothetical protein